MLEDMGSYLEDRTELVELPGSKLTDHCLHEFVEEVEKSSLSFVGFDGWQFGGVGFEYHFDVLIAELTLLEAERVYFLGEEGGT